MPAAKKVHFNHKLIKLLYSGFEFLYRFMQLIINILSYTLNRKGRLNNFKPDLPSKFYFSIDVKPLTLYGRQVRKPGATFCVGFGYCFTV